MASNQIGGALPAQMPAAVGKTDKAIAKSTANKLVAAIKTTKDPHLQAEFSKALASFSTYLAQDTKGDKKAQAKSSPKSSSRKK